MHHWLLSDKDNWWILSCVVLTVLSYFILENYYDFLSKREARMTTSPPSSPHPLIMAKVNIALEALQWCKEMLIARDEMNSKVHCAPVRLSPITERVNGAIEALSALNLDALVDVLDAAEKIVESESFFPLQKIRMQTLREALAKLREGEKK